MAAAAAGVEEDFAEAELQVAAILCDLKNTLRARERRRRRRERAGAARPEIPSWGRRRPRSMPEAEEKPAVVGTANANTPGATAERDGAASPDTPLAYPESGGDDAPPDDGGALKAAAQAQWVQEQHGVVASLSQENAQLLKQIEEYRARLQSSRSTNESLRQLHQVRRQEQQQPRALDPRSLALGLGLDLNEPAPAPAPARAADDDEQARARAAAAAAHAAEWYRQVNLRATMHKAAMAAARRRRLDILRAKAACPLVSSRPRRVGR